MKESIRKRKKLKERCPECGSSQIHYRKLLKNWKCDHAGCGAIFRKPKKDR